MPSYHARPVPGERDRWARATLTIMNDDGRLSDAERAFLDSEFGSANVRLVQRSGAYPGLALVEWSAPRRRALTPASGTAALGRAWYVLDTRVQPVASAVPTWDEIERRFPGAFVRSELPRPPWWQQVADGFRRPRRWHIAAVLAVWLALVVYAAWQLATGPRP